MEAKNFGIIWIIFTIGILVGYLIEANNNKDYYKWSQQQLQNREGPILLDNEVVGFRKITNGSIGLFFTNATVIKNLPHFNNEFYNQKRKPLLL